MDGRQRFIIHKNESAIAVKSSTMRFEPACCGILINIPCHAAICSRGFILHTAACPDINGQLDMVMFPSSPIDILEWAMPKKLKRKRTTRPETKSALPIFVSRMIIT